MYEEDKRSVAILTIAAIILLTISISGVCIIEEINDGIKDTQAEVLKELNVKELTLGEELSLYEEIKGAETIIEDKLISELEELLTADKIKEISNQDETKMALYTKIIGDNLSKQKTILWGIIPALSAMLFLLVALTIFTMII